MSFVALFLISINAFGASIWPNGSRLETFQNGFLFGNGQTIDSATDQFNFSGGARFEGPLVIEDDAAPTTPPLGFNKLFFEGSIPKALDDNGNIRPMISPNIYGENVTEEISSDQIVLPNEQATRTGENSTLIETGNLNILRNPDFEHETIETGWTCTGGTRSENLSNSITGIKTLRVINSSNTFRCEQKTSTKALRFSGTQGLASARVKTTNPSVQVCAIVNNTDTNCVSVSNNDVWQLYEIPFVMGGTNNGIVIKGATGTGTSFIDDTYVGIIKPGMITETGAVGPWIEYVPAFQGLGTPTTLNSRYRIVGSSVELNISFNVGTPTASEARIGLPLNLVADTSSSSSNISVGMWMRGVGNATTLKRDVVLVQNGTNYLTLGSGEYAIAANPFSPLNGNTLYIAGDRVTIRASVPIAGLNSRVSLYSQQCRRPSDCENVFSATSTDGASVGTVSRENLDWINGNGTNPSTGLYTFTFQSGIFTQTPNCVVTARATSGANALVYCSPIVASTNSTQLTVDCRQGGTVTDYDFDFICTKAAPDYKERNMITGSFEGIEKCADPYECTDTFSAKVSNTGVVSDENLDWITGNAAVSGTSIFTITLRVGTFTTGPNCVVSANEAVIGTFDKIAVTTSATSSTIVVQTKSANTGAAAWPFNITCQKQGVDFRPKTAVTGTFIDSVVSPGAGKPGLCSAKISSTGVISDQIGGCFASCTNATVPVCTFTTNYWVSGSIPNCWHSVNGAGGGFVGFKTTTSTTFQGQELNNSGGATAGAREYFCMGLRQ